jgi:hypothetical protein
MLRLSTNTRQAAVCLRALFADVNDRFVVDYLVEEGARITATGTGRQL